MTNPLSWPVFWLLLEPLSLHEVQSSNLPGKSISSAMADNTCRTWTYVVSICGSIDHSSIQVGRVILPVNGVELPSRIELEGAPVLQRPHKLQPMDGRTCDVEFGGQSDTAEGCRQLYL